MVMSGSKGDTFTEINKALKINTNKDLNVDESMKHLIDSIVSSTDDKQIINSLKIANKMIINDAKIQKKFSDIIKFIYKANVDQVESGDGKEEESIGKVIANTNKWVAELTNGKITNILDEDFRTASMALINVIYFNYEWKHEFDSNLTRPSGDFYSKPKVKSHFPMMNLKKTSLPYHFSDQINAHIFSLLYKDETFKFNIIFPSNEDDFLIKSDETSVINKINYTILKDTLANINYQKMNICMPKFVLKKKMKVIYNNFSFLFISFYIFLYILIPFYIF
jgi:serine protease inhibitor